MPNTKYLVDYHTHTSLCKHADGTAEAYVQQAIGLGLTEIGCSDHSPMPDFYDPEHRMTLEEFESIYKPMVSELKTRYKENITVRFGVEADYYPGTEDFVRALVNENAFDFVIGSIHFLDDWGFDNPRYIHRYDEQDVDEIYERYFQTVKQAAASGLFDILGHIDLVKKFGHRPTKSMKEILWETFKVIKENDLAVEINTAGLRKPVHEIYPSVEILEIIKDLQIPLSLGSDAHAPDDVARDFDLAIELVRKYGNSMIALFERRERRLVRI